MTKKKQGKGKGKREYKKPIGEQAGKSIKGGGNVEPIRNWEQPDDGGGSESGDSSGHHSGKNSD